MVVDNTFATPLLQRPLDLGADVVVHSVTKFLSGHSDVVLGAVVARDETLLAALAAHRTLHGAIPGPLETFLALRGLRTLPLRLERSQASAADLARRLGGHPAVTRVRHPSLPDDPGHALAATQMTGFGALVSIEVVGGPAGADAVVDAVRLWVPATSLGGVESLIERRRRHASEPAVVPQDLLRPVRRRRGRRGPVAGPVAGAGRRAGARGRLSGNLTGTGRACDTLTPGDTPGRRP